jgi:dTDP-D-glucose 4,6-dehydratase
MPQPPCFVVTGCAGFIGSHFCDHLLTPRADRRVVGVDKMGYAALPENMEAAAAEDRKSVV